ncbi:MAG: hypothetical protein R3F19_10705 [Verrucomicrobiales bacterium]
MVGSTGSGSGQDAAPESVEEFPAEVAVTVEERARHILEAEQFRALGLNPLQFLSETDEVLTELITKGSTAEAMNVFQKAIALIHAAEASREWGIQFNERITVAGYLNNQLMIGGAGLETQPGLKHADFALSALRAIAGEGVFVDRYRVGFLISSITNGELSSPATDAIKSALDQLEADLSEENIVTAMPGYHAFFQRMASSEDEFKELLDALRREATLSTSPKRTALAREMLIAGQMGLARLSDDATAGASHADYFLERIASPELPAMARLLIAETVLNEWGDLLPLPVHVAGWGAMEAGMKEGAVLPAHARALLSHAGIHATEPEFAGAFGTVATAWATRLQDDFSATPASRPNPVASALLSELIDLCVQSGNNDALKQLTAVPVTSADLRWLLTVLHYAEPAIAADYFVEFAPLFDLRTASPNISKYVYDEDLANVRLPLVIAQIDDARLRWLLRVTVAALPDQPLSGTNDSQTFRERERRLTELAEEYQALDFGSAPEVEMAALRWFTEEPDVTESLVQAYARAGASIQPQAFARPGADGKRRIVATWLGQSLNQGPGALISFLDALPSPPRSFDVAMTVGALMSSVHQAFDDESAKWATPLRKENLTAFLALLARPELTQLNGQFTGRFAALALIYHALDGEAAAFETAWTELDTALRDDLLSGHDGFLKWFDSLLRSAANDRNLSTAEQEAATRGINDSLVYRAMCDQSFSSQKRLFKDLLAANIATDQLLCRIGPELIATTPRSGYAAEELAGIQERSGQIDAALVSWDVAIEAAPAAKNSQYTKAFLAKANLLERHGRFAEALAALKTLDAKRLDKSENAAFQNTLKELRILTLSEKRNAVEMLQFAANGLKLQPDSTQGRLSAAAVFRALRLKAQASGNDLQAWAFGFLAAQTLQQLEREDKGSTGGRLDSALTDFNSMHVALGKPGGIVSLIHKGHSWRYTNAPQADGWMKPSASDESWLSGPAPLGYGSTKVRTSVDFGDHRQSKPIVTYFRTRFFLRENETVQRIAFSILRDDAAVVYLNGEEVRRDNLPAGNLTPATRALEKTSGADESRYFPGPFATERLLPGENTLAIAVHQYDPASSDLIFDAELVINDLGKDTALKAVDQEQLREALGPLWKEVPESIRNKVRRD